MNFLYHRICHAFFSTSVQQTVEIILKITLSSTKNKRSNAYSEGFSRPFRWLCERFFYCYSTMITFERHGTETETWEYLNVYDMKSISDESENFIF